MGDTVEVLFNYNYDTAEGKHIVIHKGDVFTLLAKSTDEWWKVRKGDKDKFYVPANYVRITSSDSTKPSRPELDTDMKSRSAAGRGSQDSLTPSSDESVNSLERKDDPVLYANSAMIRIDTSSSTPTVSHNLITIIFTTSTAGTFGRTGMISIELK